MAPREMETRAMQQGAPVDPANPKDLVARSKLPLGLVSPVAVAYEALGQAEGMWKYGLVNWRVTGVKASVYLDALERHLAKLKCGEWADTKTKIPHLASMRACTAILLDADAMGTLIDDRPKAIPGFSGLLDGELCDILAHVRGVFGGCSPKHHTEIEDPKPGKFRR